MAVESKFGWILSGAVEGSDSCVDVTHHTALSNLIIEREVGSCDDYDDLKHSLRRFWETETIGVRETVDEKQLSVDHEKFPINIERNGERYAVNLPWKPDTEIIASHYNLSKARLGHLQQSLEANDDLMKSYNAIINEQLESGIVEPVVNEGKIASSKRVHYMPHHAVVREDKSTTKVRIVFNGSAKSKKEELSINDCLERGPNIMPSLFDILVRFRSNPYAVVADIEKAFHMITIKEEDRDALRFLWLKRVDEGLTEVVVYRFCRLVFGLKPSPAILGSTIKHHLSNCSKSDPESRVTKVLEEDLYVDDLATGTDSQEEAINLYKSAKSVMKKGGFNLRKWNCNSSQVRKIISDCESHNINENTVAPDEEKCDASLPITINEDDSSYAKISVNPLTGNGTNKVKVLGITWNFVDDTLQQSVQELVDLAKLLPETKRSVLKLSARIFDPLGLITPFTISLKILFQELCLDSTDWDASLTASLKEKWMRIIKELASLSDIVVPRNCFASKASRILTELHGFSDASQKAYAAAVYVRVIIGDIVQIMLICSKSRVAPLKSQSIPRLELLGAVLLARLMESLRNALSGRVSIDNEYYWTDSSTVLCWIQNQRPWKQYVMRRVEEIRNLTQALNWNHCPGEWNPADLATRGIPAIKLKDNLLWWTGPEFLKSKEVIYQRISKEQSLRDEAVLQEEVKNPIPTTHVYGLPRGETAKPSSLNKIMDCRRFSSLRKLVRVTAYVFRFYRNLQCRVRKNDMQETGCLTTTEIDHARNSWLRTVQSSAFAKEFEAVERGCASNYTRQFNLYLDDQGLLRCKGRIENSGLTSEAVNPTLLPKDHHFTQLVIKEVHSRMMHSGLKSTLTAIRDCYWIPRGREVVKKFIRRCVVCTKYGGKPFPHDVPPSLPESRVDEAPPWTNTGVDYAGPLHVLKRNSVEKGITEKVYLCLFTCASTRGIHLEIVEDCSAEQFLLAFRRFVGRRGLPRLLLSDNAKNFKTSAKLITKIGRTTKVQEHIGNVGVEWKFIVEKAPWWGGFWERLIRLTKDCIKKVVGRAVLTFEELRTLLVEVEAVVNSRPLTYVYDDVDGVSYSLSPAHLMYGRRITACKNGENWEVISTHESLTKRARHHRQLLRQFTRKWKHEYLTGLRENARIAKRNEPHVTVGDIVILKKEGTAKCFWKLAKVTKLLTGNDGKVRAAEIRVMNSDGQKSATTLRRPLQLLVPIEVTSSNENNEDRATSITTTKLDPKVEEFVPARMRREAAVNGELRRRIMDK